MRTMRLGTGRAGLLGLLALASVAFLAGCDERVVVDRDPSVRVQRGMTWAWRPQPTQ